MAPRAHVPAPLRSTPFRGTEARRRGLLTDDQLRSAHWRRLARDVYVHAEAPDDLATRTRALALLLPPGGVLSGTAAAWLHGADIRRWSDPVEATLPRDTPMRPPAGVRLRRAEIRAEDVTVIGGLPVTTPLRTAFDLSRRPAARGDLTENVVAADAFAHLGLVGVEELTDYARRDRFHRWRGVRQVPVVAALTEPLSESPSETRVRMRIVRAGLPRPQAQVEIRTPGGAFVARADLAYPHLRMAIEYDGACHDDRRAADAARRNRMREVGWGVYVYTATDLRPGQTTIERQIRRALEHR